MSSKTTALIDSSARYRAAVHRSLHEADAALRTGDVRAASAMFTRVAELYEQHGELGRAAVLRRYIASLAPSPAL